jgi:hypothetical protein
MKRSIALIFALLCVSSAAFSQYDTWSHRGTLALLTTPEGANLPADASEEGFPVLVRLRSETFDFLQANADGSDIRFSAEGQPLAYQIESWDSESGEANIWVRIPVIRGNTRQELTLHWGKADAKSDSNGKAVFNESNGFVVTMHLGDAVRELTTSCQVSSVHLMQTGAALNGLSSLDPPNAIISGFHKGVLVPGPTRKTIRTFEGVPRTMGPIPMILLSPVNLLKNSK